jgi:FkbM family methyltransferase
MRAAARRHVLRVARRLGVEPQLRRAQDALAPWEVWRNRRDDAHLRAVMAAVLAPDANGIDVGANVGEVLATLVRLAPRGRHVAYEPLPELASALAERFPGVDVHRAALSRAAGEATFYRRTDAPSRSALQPLGGPVEPVPVRLEALDDSLPDGYVPHFVKIDVEGAELAVLEGALGTLRKHRPLVAFEHGRTALEYGTTHGMVHDLLCGEAGLRIFDMDGDGPFDRETFERVADPPGRRWNFLARP